MHTLGKCTTTVRTTFSKRSGRVFTEAPALLPQGTEMARLRGSPNGNGQPLSSSGGPSLRPRAETQRSHCDPSALTPMTHVTNTN